ncbi:hypothetical protein, partial [Klebsiella pneumoniae]|uniref:hypothetical protein n=1 Tax=Klebsiella pneumoniae TaxID=573 RepID=UPI0013D5F63D
MTISNGGLVSNAGDGFVGYGGSSIAQARVDGAGSAWVNATDLYVGYYGQGILDVRNGGTVNSRSGLIGFM